MREDDYIDEIIANFRYCKESGSIYRIKKPNKGRSSFDSNSPAGFVMNGGYRAVKLNGERFLCHRLAFVLVNKVPAQFNVDHINGNRLDNSWKNLRECTAMENAQNQKKLGTRKSLSKYLGVSFSKEKGKWISSIDVEKKRIFLGAFADELDAANAYKEAKLKYHRFNPVLRDG